MAEKPKKFREEIGIFEKEWEEIDFQSDNWSERIEAASRSDHWKSYFPSREWLEQQRGDAPARILQEYSEEWFVKSMLDELGLLENAVKKSDPAMTAIHAGALGRLMVESNMKTRWEAHALRGKGTIEDSAKGGKARAAAYKSHHEAIRKDYWERLARLGDESAAKNATAREFSIVRRTLNRILAK